MRRETKMRYDKFLLFASIVNFAAGLYFMVCALEYGEMVYSAQGTANLACALVFLKAWADR